MRHVSLLCLVPFVLACNSNSNGSGSGPQILSLGTSTARITESGSLTISAVVTDPDGIGDLIGGSLETADGATTFGAFASAAEEGAYQLVLPWQTFEQTLDLTFEGERPLDLAVEFFDAGGDSARESLKVTLYCPAPFSHAIRGECVGLDVCRCNGAAGCDAALTCDAYCAARQMDCATTCPFPDGDLTGAVVVFESLASCQSHAQAYVPVEGSTCTASLENRRGYQCCCSPR